MNTSFTYTTKLCSQLDDKTLKQCSDLFSNHYGVYSGKDKLHSAGQQIRLGLGFYRRLREKESMRVALCYKDEELIGQAFYLDKVLSNGDKCSWVTQLVVNSAYRKNGIAKRLLHSAWGFSNYVAWGLATANALTIKTLRSATFREIEPESILKHLDLIDAMCEDIDFAKEKKWEVGKGVSQIFTNFYPVHEDKDKATTDLYVHKLGKLQDGYEWLAFTFRSQDSVLWEDYLDDVLSFSAQQLEDAYSRMDMENQPWTRFTAHEIDYVLEKTGIKERSRVLDLGCGIGRHTIELAKRGMMVSSVEPSPRLMDRAINKALSQLTINQIDKVTFLKVDGRKSPLIRGQYDAVICLYDVIGSYRTTEENTALLKTISKKLKKGGRAVISVMSMDLTKSIAKNRADVRQSPQALLNLNSSNIMQNTGNVFDPEYFLLDEKSHLVYRKEQFEYDGMLSSEYVLADYRFTRDEIVAECEANSLSVLETSFVALGQWDTPLAPDDKRAKEILVVLEKK